MNKRTMIVAFATLAVFALAVASGDDTRFEARLSGMADGKAKYKEKPNDWELQFEIEFEGEDLAANTNYIVLVGTENAWQVRTDGLGSFEFEERSFGPVGLPIHNGTPVIVNDMSGTTVMAGVFASK